MWSDRSLKYLKCYLGSSTCQVETGDGEKGELEGRLRKIQTDKQTNKNNHAHAHAHAYANAYANAMLSTSN